MKQATSILQDAPVKPFDYRSAADSILKTLRRDRDRQIIARRFGFGMQKRQTLEKIGTDFGITRERVRQIEKATLGKMGQSRTPEVTQANQLFLSYLKPTGDIAALVDVVAKLGAPEQDTAYILFLAALSPDIEVIEEDDQLKPALAARPNYDRAKVKKLSASLSAVIADLGQPATLKTIVAATGKDIQPATIESIAKISKTLAEFDSRWGLSTWPAVNPKSIRDKTYLVLSKHGQPLHFGTIAEHIKKSSFTRRNVTVQAVHNELIKDGRFILIGRGIYALAEWGYAPGTVADIIVEILREESPLHKDQIIERVLNKRQVKTTTIVLNLQEKDQFERVAKATYKLREDKQ